MGVLNAQKVVMDAIKPGFSWIECHRLAEREVLTALLGMEILQNGSIDDFMACSMGAIFMPHGLGHLIGCDTHDVGG